MEVGALEFKIPLRAKELLAMARIVTVTKMGRDAPSDSMRYRVEIIGQDERTFEVRVPLTAVASKAVIKVAIQKLFSYGWLPEHGAVHLLGGTGW
jgi:hypothetical protein